MNKFRTAALTGVAALVAAGVGIAAARDTRIMKINLPDGSVARLEYSGDVTPGITFAPVSAPLPFAFEETADTTPFAALEQLGQEMNLQAAAMIQQAELLEALPDLTGQQVELAKVGPLPRGTIRYEFVSTSSGSGTCARSVEMNSLGARQQPKIVSETSGDCRPAEQESAPMGLGTSAHPALRNVPERPETEGAGFERRQDRLT